MFRAPTIACVVALVHAGTVSAEDLPVDPTDGDVVTSAIESSDDDPYQPTFIGFPVVGFTPETSWAFAAMGMAQWRFRDSSPDARSSSLIVAAAYTLRRQWLLGIDPSFVLKDDAIRLGGSLVLDDWLTDYFGIGDDARLSDRESYAPRRVSGEVTFEHTAGHPNFYVGALAHASAVRVRDVAPTGILQAESPTGTSGGRSMGLGALFTWDGRDIEYFPSRGTYAQVQVRGYLRALGSDFDFAEVSTDLRGFLTVGRRASHVLAAQLRTDVTTGDAPFYELPRLGGMSAMRGMTTGRFRDSGSWDGQIEYRTPFFWRFGFVGFGGLGDVFHRMRASELADPKWTLGTGVRFQVDPESGVNIRLDYGFSSEEYDGVYLAITEAF